MPEDKNDERKPLPDRKDRVSYEPGYSGKKPPSPRRIPNDKSLVNEDNLEDLMGVFDPEVEQIGDSGEQEESDEAMTGVVLLSGGMDSVAALAWAIREKIKVHALIMDYGASNTKQEIKAAKRVARYYKVPFQVQKINLPIWNRGLMADEPDIYFKDSEKDQVAGEYVPARNTIFLAYAYAYAETFDMDAIIVGFNAGMLDGPDAEDFGYMPDTSPVYCRAFQYVINTSTAREKYTIALIAPFLRATKADIAEFCQDNKVPLKYSYSCFKGDETACGICRTCVARLRAFEDAGLDDPVPYQDREFYKSSRIGSDVS
jgi:7-cyano-7-deazaguanine synthase